MGEFSLTLMGELPHLIPRLLFLVVAITRCIVHLSKWPTAARLALTAFSLLLISEITVTCLNYFLADTIYRPGSPLNAAFQIAFETLPNWIHVVAVALLVTAAFSGRKAQVVDSSPAEMAEMKARARVRLILAIAVAGITILPPAGIAAWLMASRALQSSTSRPKPWQLQLAYYLGVVGTTISLLAIIFYLYLQLTTGKQA